MLVIGVDEAGRGPLVGSVVAAAVAFPPDFRIDGLTDSKKLSEKKREALYNQITRECYWSFAQSNSNEIDQINILEATMLAMKKAVEQLMLLLEDNSQTISVLVDGNRCPDIENCRAIIKGDLTEPVISAASIIAKVTRDRQMIALDQKYPEYGFAKHKGYGTRAHLEALANFGPIQGQHRFTFAPVKKLIRP
ncbi:MAG: ribonuclease HII [Candidatus Thioglobus sp.]|nr:ribonuclease HII [Candidatus Thioglobus sp.]